MAQVYKMCSEDSPKSLKSGKVREDDNDERWREREREQFANSHGIIVAENAMSRVPSTEL